MLARLLDRLVLQPTTDELPTDGRVRRDVDFPGGSLEVWSALCACRSEADAELFVLKFPGTGGRAERASANPADVIGRPAAVWAVNPPGYGGSPGRASLRHTAPSALAAFDALQRVAGDRPIIVTANSLGSLAALHVAAHRPVSGLLLRDPVPLKQLIQGRHRWRPFWGAAWLLGRRAPNDVDSVANAAAARAPLAFVSSERDRVVPNRYQRLIFDAYAGEKKILNLAGADHGQPLAPEHEQAYTELIQWLAGRLSR